MKELKLLKERHNNTYFYFYEKKYFDILKEILYSNYKVIQEFKNDKRTYVAKILINDKYYILKRVFKNKKIKKYLSIFKKSESLLTLININLYKNNGIDELVDVLGAALEKRNGIVINEFFLMEYCEGEKVSEDKELLKVISILDKLYSKGIFHGDCNPGNFILNKEENIKILDTKLKKMVFGDYRKHYDILTLMKHFKNKPLYPYKKNIFYYFALLIRKIRNIKNSFGR